MSVQSGEVGGNGGGSLDVGTVFCNGANLIVDSFICIFTGCFFSSYRSGAVSYFFGNGIRIGFYLGIKGREVGEYAAVFLDVVAVGINGTDFIG